MTKEERYAALFPAARSLVGDEEDIIARMANLAALIHREFGFWWTGFYRVADDKKLVLGPFQGPLACTGIGFGKGVCGTAWAEDRTVVVPDVSKFPGHIACSSESRSEIVVPVRKGGRIAAVLDIDSKELGTFDEVDALWLERIADCVYGRQRDIWFAAGCFWGAQKFFKMIDGVRFTEVGFANGNTENPSYKQVYTDTTGYAEAVRVCYDPAQISLQELVRLYFQAIDPLSLNKQGEDEGTRYRTGIYYSSEGQLAPVMEVVAEVEAQLGAKTAVEVLPLKNFVRAEDYHQDYLDKNPGGYCHLSPAIFELARKYKAAAPQK